MYTLWTRCVGCESETPSVDPPRTSSPYTRNTRTDLGKQIWLTCSTSSRPLASRTSASSLSQSTIPTTDRS
jgi:hypothetical protein